MPIDNALHQDHSILSLILNASLPVQLVMLMLLLASVISWYMIDRKRTAFKRWNNVADDFEEAD